MSDEKVQSTSLLGDEEELTPEQREIERMKQVLLNEEPEKMAALLRALNEE